MKHTKENYDALQLLFQSYKEKVLHIVKEMVWIEHETELDYDVIQDLSFGPETVELELIHYSQYSGYSDESSYYEFPVHYLFNDQWTELFKEKVQQKKQELLRKEQERNEARRQETTKQEWALYEELKAKFEQNPPQF